jgi:chromosomal replication initiation ATPase DnaA
MYCNQIPSTLESNYNYNINKLTLLADLCEIVGIDFDNFFSRNRHRIFLDKKHIVITLYKRYSGYTFEQTGIDCGGYDHTSVMHICKKIQNYCDTDQEFKKAVLKYENDLKNLNS